MEVLSCRDGVGSLFQHVVSGSFSSLSIELAVELQEAFKFQEFSDEKRTEIHDLLDMLQGNLGKIVQHG
jgi:two-component system NtrC family sensor kinase